MVINVNISQPVPTKDVLQQAREAAICKAPCAETHPSP